MEPLLMPPGFYLTVLLKKVCIKTCLSKITESDRYQTGYSICEIQAIRKKCEESGEVKDKNRHYFFRMIMIQSTLLMQWNHICGQLIEH